MEAGSDLLLLVSDSNGMPERPCTLSGNEEAVLLVFIAQKLCTLTKYAIVQLYCIASFFPWMGCNLILLHEDNIIINKFLF